MTARISSIALAALLGVAAGGLSITSANAATRVVAGPASIADRPANSLVVPAVKLQGPKTIGKRPARVCRGGSWRHCPT
ncbi:hypothetical protein [Bradyrhizobium sp. ORS 285]|uniref:hypothetical protein n=1 Tax=Bradyrhizobium sp. ORS 285 TaxID=115808 RepID=UPI0003029F14|nr:hypothetical protein [Bradyrhizobium sp. ORS 285]